MIVARKAASSSINGIGGHGGVRRTVAAALSSRGFQCSSSSSSLGSFAPPSSMSRSAARASSRPASILKPPARHRSRHFSSEAAAAVDEESSGDETAAPTTTFAPTPERKYQYFQNVHVTADGVAVVKFDNRDQKYNTINKNLRDEARKLWDDDVHTNPDVKSVVWTSAKADGFVAGADVFDIKDVEDKSELVPFIEEWLRFFQHMKSAGKPAVCAIHGPALGGGLEWALWCDYRVCTDSPSTKLGLPEVKLGLLPGFGGTQLLHPLVGLQKALDVTLTGKDVRAKQAKKMGLVDAVVDPARLEAVAIDAARGLADGSVPKSKPKKKSWMDWAIEDTPVGRNIMWKKVAETVAKNTGGNYPAPEAIIECVKYGLDHPTGEEKFKFERESFAKLAATSESEALIGIFEGVTKMKKHDFGSDVKAKKAKKVAVVGAGLMGAGIAQVTAEKAKVSSVLLKDRNDEAVAKGASYMTDNWDKKTKRRRMERHARDAAASRIVPLTDDSPHLPRHWSDCDVVVEAVFESLDLKRQILADVEAVTPSHCVFATNTSAIPIASIADGCARPQNVVGMHYFSPVPSMPLLEIIPHDGTSDEALAAAFDLGTRQGKTVVVVKDVPGFYVNRCLGPFLVEVSALVRDGADLEVLDESMKKFGMPVGPVTLADEVGMDVTYHVAKFLSEADLGTRMEGGDVRLMEGMVERGWLGKKSGKGFYAYGDGGKKKGKGKKVLNPEVKDYIRDFTAGHPKVQNLDAQEMQDRMVTRFVNEAVKCLEDDIIADPIAGDIGLVFGTGFAPFRGGPFRYVDAVGADAFTDKMSRLADKYGPQFEPCQFLKDHAASGKKFHQS